MSAQRARNSEKKSHYPCDSKFMTRLSLLQDARKCMEIESISGIHIEIGSNGLPEVLKLLGYTQAVHD
jgi:hypothetical protein